MPDYYFSSTAPINICADEFNVLIKSRVLPLDFKSLHLMASANLQMFHSTIYLNKQYRPASGFQSRLHIKITWGDFFFFLMLMPRAPLHAS